ncbi:hypothetical protein BDZ89DRAFT_1152718 [Hymenopellis radicata]|nr:hypothetical protein BDZ89DRAFT_1152718 [Hymenopellis radicata]
MGVWHIRTVFAQCARSALAITPATHSSPLDVQQKINSLPGISFDDDLPRVTCSCSSLLFPPEYASLPFIKLFILSIRTNEARQVALR